MAATAKEESPLVRKIVPLLATALAVALGLTLSAGPAEARRGHPPTMLGPGDANVSGIKGEALIRMSRWGYVYIAGQQHTHLTIKTARNGKALHYRDTGTRKLNKIPKRCDRHKVRKGISVTCGIPKKFRKKMFVQVWPRLGNDYVDGRTLPHRFRMWVLEDAGRGTFYGGHGNDFFNGAKTADRAFGGAGRDWIRTGPGNDHLWGGRGKDKLVCAENRDTAHTDGRDSFYKCERVRRT
jgi:hypothetical protein